MQGHIDLMAHLQRRWSDCQTLAEMLKRRSLASPAGGATPEVERDAEKSTAEAIADLQRRSELLRHRYGL